MTPTEALSLPAGSELDRFVLTEVLGWRWGGEHWEKDEAHRIVVFLGQPKPSERLHDAWRLEAALFERGWHMEMMHCMELNGDGGPWMATFKNWDKRSFSGDGYGATPPLAICRAALRVIIAEQEHKQEA